MVLTAFILAVLTPFKAQAIYQIYTCNVVKTRIDGGDWVSRKQCYVSGYGGSGSWSNTQDRESASYIDGSTTYIVDGVEVTEEEATKSTVEACLDTNFALMQECKRWVNIAATGSGAACLFTANSVAILACETVVILGHEEAHMMCDRNQRTQDKECNKITNP